MVEFYQRELASIDGGIKQFYSRYYLSGTGQPFFAEQIVPDTQVPEADNDPNTTADLLVIQEGVDFPTQPSLIDLDFTIPVEEVKAQLEELKIEETGPGPVNAPSPSQAMQVGASDTNSQSADIQLNSASLGTDGTSEMNASKK